MGVERRAGKAVRVLAMKPPAAPTVTELELQVLRDVAACNDPWRGHRGVGSRRYSQALGRLERKGLLRDREWHEDEPTWMSRAVTDDGRAALREAEGRPTT